MSDGHLPRLALLSLSLHDHCEQTVHTHGRSFEIRSQRTDAAYWRNGLWRDSASLGILCFPPLWGRNRLLCTTLQTLLHLPWSFAYPELAPHSSGTRKRGECHVQNFLTFMSVTQNGMKDEGERGHCLANGTPAAACSRTQNHTREKSLPVVQQWVGTEGWRGQRTTSGSFLLSSFQPCRLTHSGPLSIPTPVFLLPLITLGTFLVRYHMPWYIIQQKGHLIMN